MTDKLIAKPSFTEMQKSLPRIEGCIEELEKIDISTIIKGNESTLGFVS